MSAADVLVRAGTMLLSAPDGSVGADDDPGAVEGLFVADTRCLSRWGVTVDGAALDLAGSRRAPDRRTVALVPRTRRGVSPGFILVRDQSVRLHGLTEHLTLRAGRGEPVTVALTVEVASDFADPFELRQDGRVYDHDGAVATVGGTSDGLVMSYRREREREVFAREVRVRTAARDARFAPFRPTITTEALGDRLVVGTLIWTVELPPGGTWELRIDVDAGTSTDAATTVVTPDQADATPVATGPLVVESVPGRTAVVVPGLCGDHPHDAQWLAEVSLADLDCLLMPAPGNPDLWIPAAGVPWFLTLFGRDSLLTALMVRDERPDLLPAVVEALAAAQGTRDDPGRREQPGKIPHELRVSELAVLGQVPYGRYYGTVDGTPLFLMGLGALDDDELVGRLEGVARAAVAWIRGPGGLDESGFLTYVPDPHGLLNQGWKDSRDAIVHRDGSLAEGGAIALCEAQGYAWRALVDTARLARSVWDDAVWADELDDVAASLRERFTERFWLEGEGFPALALDGTGRQVATVASNAGHLLWCGMLSPEKAQAVARRLLAADVFTGWGLRTVAANGPAFRALSYHRGSVWPHDTMLAAVGMAAYGLHEEAATLAGGLLDAARHVGGHLPELFGGNTAEEFPSPLVYARAGVPQAWAAAAGVVAARILREGPDSL